MPRSIDRVLAALAFAVLGLTAAARSAQGYVETPPYLTCFNDSQADESALAATLSPAENATVAAGTPLTLASFSDSSIAACAGLTPTTYTTPARTLTVTPAPGNTAVIPEEPLPPLQTTPAPLHAGLLSAGGFDARHPLVAYRVHCSASCRGQSSCDVFARERHRRTPAASVLDLPPAAVSISTAGGEQRITHRYTGAALHALRRIARAGGRLELHCALTVSETPGATSVQSAAWLRA